MEIIGKISKNMMNAVKDAFEDTDATITVAPDEYSRFFFHHTYQDFTTFIKTDTNLTLGYAKFN